VCACSRLLQANFPTTFARLPKLAVLDMKNNKFKCVCPRSDTPNVWSSNLYHATLQTVPSCPILSAECLPCRGELPNIRGMFSALRYFDVSSNVVGGFIPQAWADTGIIRLVRLSIQGSGSGVHHCCAVLRTSRRIMLLLLQCPIWGSTCVCHD
jgi:hypothetical protein